MNFCVKFQNCLYWSKNETIDLLRFDLFSRWLQDVFQAVCVHLGWCLTVREVASSQRPVPVFTMASLTSLERPLRWTATPGKWIKQGIQSYILEWGSLDWFEKSFCIVLCAGWHCCDPSSSVWLFLSNVTSPHFTSVNTNNLDLRSFLLPGPTVLQSISIYWIINWYIWTDSFEYKVLLKNYASYLTLLDTTQCATKM